jgi:DNA-binding phage protein
MKYRTWHEVLVEQLADPEEALDYLQFALDGYQKDGDTSFFLRALRTVIEAQGEIAQLAKKTGIAPGSLSKVLSSDEPPRIDMFVTILNAFGWRLSIEPLEDVSPNLEIPSEERVRLKSTREKSVEQIAEASPS